MTDDSNPTPFIPVSSAAEIIGPSITTPHRLPFEAEPSSISSQIQVNFGIFPEEPGTTLGARLMAIRQRAIDQGMTLLTQDEILAEVRRRRGELPDEDDPNLP